MKKQKGFTLLEMIISMAIITIAMGAIFMAFSMALRLFVEESMRTDSHIEADRSMSRMIKELRGSKQIISTATREVTFWLSDENENDIREADETVTFTWTGSPEYTLNRTSSNETLHLAYDVYDFTLTYDDPFDIGLIDISITIGEGPTHVTLESSAKLRNI
jgi:prepilin-type N-terminal cleavage/methylation domain-containing protein